MKMDDPPVLTALSLSLASLFLYNLPVMERNALCSVSCLDSHCKAPHFVYQLTFQPIPPPPTYPPLPPLSSSFSSSFVSYSFHFLFSLVCCRLSTPFICFNLVAHYSKEKSFLYREKKTQLFFLFLCLTTNICSPLQIQ